MRRRCIARCRAACHRWAAAASSCAARRPADRHPLPGAAGQLAARRRNRARGPLVDQRARRRRDRKRRRRCSSCSARSREREVLSINAQGRAREYQLRLRRPFACVDPSGIELIRPTTLTRARDIAFNEAELLAKESEEGAALSRHAERPGAADGDASRREIRPDAGFGLTPSAACWPTRNAGAAATAVRGQQRRATARARGPGRASARRHAAGLHRARRAAGGRRFDWSRLTQAARGLSLFADGGSSKSGCPAASLASPARAALEAHRPQAVPEGLLTCSRCRNSTAARRRHAGSARSHVPACWSTSIPIERAGCRSGSASGWRGSSSGPAATRSNSSPSESKAICSRPTRRSRSSRCCIRPASCRWRQVTDSGAERRTL